MHESALEKVDPAYIKQLEKSPDWLPGPEKIFSAFSLPMIKLTMFYSENHPIHAENRPMDTLFGMRLWKISGLQLV